MNDTASKPGKPLADIIKKGGPDRRLKARLFAGCGLVLVAVLVWLVLGGRTNKSNTLPPFTTEPLGRGNIALIVTATGNLEPTNEVTVGSELSGTVLEVLVDINDRVSKGQALARLDTTKLAQQTESKRATLKSTQARVAQAQATLREAEASLARQDDLKRLSGGKLPSKADYEASSATAERARADLLSAQAAVAEAEAQVLSNESDLGKAIIRSPIDGIVLTRSVEPGQTVAASFTAPELFVIAENLEHMKLKVAVAEADIGRLAQGQKASFTVDAWANRSYEAKVIRVSYGSSVTNNVVTYETELTVSNSDLSLRPGMTATASIRVAESQNTLLVPTAALRFTPAPAGAGAATAKKSFVQSLLPGPPPRPAARSKAGDALGEGSAPAGARIWVLREGRPEPLPVNTGLSDGRRTEISGEGLTEGLPIILRHNAPQS